MTKKKKKEELTWKEKRSREAVKHQRALKAERLKREKKQEKSTGWSKGKIFGIAFVLLLMIGIYGAWQYTLPPSNGNPNSNKQKAPLFTLTDIEGNAVALEDLVGKIVILDFFYPQCGYCDDEVVHLEEIYEEYSRDELEIISISVKEISVQDLRDFKRGPNRFSDFEYEMSWIIARDTGTQNVVGTYGISGYPTTVIIDREGYLSPNSPFMGLTTAPKLSNEIDYLLGS